MSNSRKNTEPPKATLMDSLRKKHSIQAVILRLFLIAILLSTIISGLLSFKLQFDRILAETKKDALGALELCKTILMDIDLTKPISAGAYSSSRILMRDICQKFGLQYIYVVTKGPYDHSVEFLYVVASSDTDDAMVRAERRYGTVIDADFSSAEKAAFAGSEEPQYWSSDNKYGKVISWTLPVKDHSGKVVAVITGDILVSSFVSQFLSSFLAATIPYFLVLLTTMFLLVFILRRRVFLPLAKISKAMSGFASGQDLHAEPLHITSMDEMQEIADSFKKMTKDIRVYTENQKKIADAQARVHAQLDIARNIQYGMVPATFYEKKAAAEVSASMRPAREVGGDFYDCFFRRDGNLCVVMADVSGKGITAALFMAMAKSTLHELLSLGFSPAEALNRANDELCAQNPEGMFVTVFAMVLDVLTGKVLAANAGHNPPVLYGNGEPRLYTPAPGIAMALFEDAGLEDEEFTLAPGEGIFLYTDGITESVSIDKTFYGMDRLLKFFQTEQTSTQAVLAGVLSSVDTFAAGAEQFDDMTMATVRYLGGDNAAPSADDSSGDITLANGAPAANASSAGIVSANGAPATNDSSAGIISANGTSATAVSTATPSKEDISMNNPAFYGSLEPALSSFDVIKETVLNIVGRSPEAKQILLAAEEAFVNIISYSKATAIGYEIRKNDSDLSLIFVDDGTPFNPFEASPDKDFDDFDTGGMGILLIQNIAKTTHYAYEDGQNRLTLTFDLDR